MMSSWGGGNAPPMPPSVAPPTGHPPPSSDGKKYADERQTELDALRQRGLARLLNKHFTTVTKAIAEERAAAEAALADLEARKANTSEFTSSNSGLTYYQQLYMELQEKKATCKRKERETLLLYQRYVDKFAYTGVVAVPSSRDMKIGLPPIPSTTKPSSSYMATKKTSSTKITEMADEIDEKVNKHVSTGGDKIPSAHFLGMDETLQSRRASEEREYSEFSKRVLEAKGVDAVASPLPAKRALAMASQFGIPISPDVSTSIPRTKTSVDSNATTPSALETSADDDDRSAVSGLTSTASPVTSEAEERLLEFLRTESEEIRKMMENDENQSFSSKSDAHHTPESKNTCVSTESALAAEKAEEMVKQMQKMLMDHGLLKHEVVKKAIEPYELVTPNPNEKWLVCWDETHQREYYFETKMGLTQWEKPNTEDDDYVPIVDYTTSSKNILSNLDVMPGLLHPRMSRRDTYRRTQRRRRKRQRIVGAIMATVACVAVYYAYCRHLNDPSFGSSLSRAFVEPAQRVLDRMIGMERVKEIHHTLHKVVFRYIPTSVTEDTERRIREEAERTIRAEMAAKEKVRLARLETDRIVKEEKARLAKLEVAEKLAKEELKKEAELASKEKVKQEEAVRQERERILEEDALRKERERNLAAETKQKALRAKELRLEAQREREESRRQAIEERKRNAMMRPWHCNFPLSYIVNKKCRKLSSTSPIFDLRTFVDAMIQ